MIHKVGKQVYQFGAAYRLKADATRAAKAYRSAGYLVRVVRANVGPIIGTARYTYRVFYRFPKSKK